MNICLAQNRYCTAKRIAGAFSICNTVNTLSREEQAGVLHRHEGQVEDGPGRRLAGTPGGEARLAGNTQEERWMDRGIVRQTHKSMRDKMERVQ